MSSQIQQILNILVDYPGNLVYHLILTFSIIGAWYLALSQGLHSRRARRLALGLSLLVAIRIILFLGAAAAWPGLLDGFLLPPLDRALALLSLVIIVWLWAFSEPQPSADAATALLGLLTLTLLAMALVFWSEQRIFGTKFNGSWLDIGGEAVAIALLLGGILALSLIRPMSWGLGLGMLVILLAGHALYLALTLRGPTLPGDYAGPVRLFELAAFALLLALPLSVPIPVPEPAPAPGTVERRRYAADPQLVQSLLALGREDTGPVCKPLTQAVASAMVADVCLLATYGEDAGQVAIHCGYDLIREQTLEGTVFPEADVPVIESVLRLARATRLPAGSSSPDLGHLALALRLERAGSFLAAPVTAPEGKPLAAIVLLTPYSNRAWDATDQEALAGIAASLAQLLQRSGKLAQAQAEAADARRSLLEAQSASEAAGQAQEQAQAELLALRDQVKSLTALVNSQEELQPPTRERLLLLGASAAALAATPETPAEDPLKGEYLLALEEISSLKNALAAANGQSSVTETGPGGRLPLDLEQREAIKSIAEELREPATSVTNYAEFLLAESTGALGELQRKFLERIKASTRRMSVLVEDLFQIADSVERRRPQSSVNLADSLSAALAYTEGERTARGLRVEVDRPEQLPRVQADAEALEGIFTRLLQNATAATPDAGEVRLRALTQGSSDGHEYVLVQVSDQGGGISSADLPRVFSGLYTDDSPVIPGTGATCIELAAVRQVVEALQGRIWVDSNPGSGSTFSVLLPAAALPNTGHPAAGEELEGQTDA